MKVEQEERIERLGNEYGGFGVACDFLDQTKEQDELIVFSFGIGEDLSFDEEVIRKWQAKVYAYDPTPKAIEYVKNHPLSKNELFSFDGCGVSAKDKDEEIFYLPRNPENVSGSLVIHDEVDKCSAIKVKMRTIDTLMEHKGLDRIDILKMDIEGSEFEVLEGFKNIKKCGQICFETHDRFYADGMEKLKKLVDHLTSNGFSLVYVDGKYLDLTFINSAFKRI